MSLSVKKEALNMIRHLPEKADWDDIMYEIYVRKKIAQGIEAADSGKLVPHQEVKGARGIRSIKPRP